MPDPVLGNVEAAAPLLIGYGDPVGADDNQYCGAGIEPLLQGLHEIGSGVDAGDVLKNLLTGEVPPQVFSKPSRHMLTVTTAVADEDA